jgi:predicted RNase H-like HicB family nuclease
LKRTFNVAAIWDNDAKVFVSQSDIPGLVIEAETFDEFVSLVDQLAPVMVADNVPEMRGNFTVHVSAQRDMRLTAA